MQRPTKKRQLVMAVACVVVFGVASVPAAADNDLPGDSSVPFWPHETGALVGTSETYIDVRADGSYYDPSIGHRVIAR